MMDIVETPSRNSDALIELTALVAFQNLLFCMMCMGSYSARDVYQKHREFAQALLG